MTDGRAFMVSPKPASVEILCSHRYQRPDGRGTEFTEIKQRKTFLKAKGKATLKSLFFEAF